MVSSTMTVANLPPSLTIKALSKSAGTWRSDGKEYRGNFFDSVYTSLALLPPPCIKVED